MQLRSLTTVGLAAVALTAGPAEAVPIRGPTGNFDEFVATPTEWPDVLCGR